MDVTGHFNNLERLLCKDSSLPRCETVLRHESQALTVTKPIKHA